MKIAWCPWLAVNAGNNILNAMLVNPPAHAACRLGISASTSPHGVVAAGKCVVIPNTPILHLCPDGILKLLWVFLSVPRIACATWINPRHIDSPDPANACL